MAPFPPLLWPSNTTTSIAPNFFASSFITFISADVSDENLFIDTTTGISVVVKFNTWRLQFEETPIRTASIFSVSISSLDGRTPPPVENPPP